MWKGIKKALGHRAKTQKTSTGQDSSTRSSCSAGQSSHGGALFPLDMTELDAMLTADASSKQHQSNQQQPAPAAALTWAQLQQQLQQQHAVQALMQQTEDSTSKRRAAAMQKRVNNSMLNPSTCMYQIKALLSLSTLFEHKVSCSSCSCRGWCVSHAHAAAGHNSSIRTAAAARAHKEQDRMRRAGTAGRVGSRSRQLV